MEKEKLVYIQVNWGGVDDFSWCDLLNETIPLLGNKRFKRISYSLFVTLLTSSDINYLKLSFPKLVLIYEGSTHKTLYLRNQRIDLLPKDIEVDFLLIERSDIHYIHPSIKVKEFDLSSEQLYHIPKSFNITYSRRGAVLQANEIYQANIRNFRFEEEKRDRMGEYAYYKEIEEICDGRIKNEISRLKLYGL